MRKGHKPMSNAASVIADNSMRVNGKRRKIEAMLDYTARTKHAKRFVQALEWLDIDIGSRPSLHICTVRKCKLIGGCVCANSDMLEGGPLRSLLAVACLATAFCTHPNACSS